MHSIMASPEAPRKVSFFKAHILPALFIFLIPGFSAWFFDYAESTTDREALTQVESQIQAAPELTDSQRAERLEFFRKTPVSEIMASDDPKLERLQPSFEFTGTLYATFRWMKRIAWLCLGAIVATFVIVGLSVAFSFRSQSAQYYALRIGWPVLRTSAAIQVLGQAVLAVELSFWVTAILTKSYFIKLIFIIGMFAVLAVLALFKAIFAKVHERYEVRGVSLPDAEAPDLWQRVRDMAAQLKTVAPHRIIVGIDPSFFVTEHPVTLAREVQRGRTLYLSLPMLKVMAMDEAEAVLGHELAHFSGQDTFWSRKITPLTGKFALYLRTLASGLSLIVAHFMHLFWKLYSLSILRLSRAREFRADRVGAELVSKEAMKRALVKVTCYCEYRAKTEAGILNKPQVDENLNLALQLEQGYAGFLHSFAENDQAIEERVPHPFDSHPTLKNRLAQLGFDARAVLRDGEIQKPAEKTWYQAIGTAPAREEKMWAERQEALQSFHAQSIAWRLLPKDEQETAVVRQHFPRTVFRNKRGAEAVLEFDRLQLPDLSVPILFKDIRRAFLENAWPTKRLTLSYLQDGKSKPQVRRFHPSTFSSEKGDLLQLFGQYYNRHKAAEANSSPTPTPKTL
jgi:Zn-dependent protease with chaperone function